jgi:hypothetical protein
LLEEAFELLGFGKKATSLPEVQLRALRELVERLRKEKRGAAAKRARTSDAPARVAPTMHVETQSDAPARVAPTMHVETQSDAPARVAPTMHVETQSDAPARVTHSTERATLQSSIAADATQNEAAPARTTPQHPKPQLGRDVPVQVGRAVWARDASQCAYVDERGRRCAERRGLELHHRKAYALGGPPTEHNLELRCRPHNTLAAEEDFGREHMDRIRGWADTTTRLAAP